MSDDQDAELVIWLLLGVPASVLLTAFAVAWGVRWGLGWWERDRPRDDAELTPDQRARRERREAASDDAALARAAMLASLPTSAERARTNLARKRAAKREATRECGDR